MKRRRRLDACSAFKARRPRVDGRLVERQQHGAI
jgi:hypothetical protein